MTPPSRSTLTPPARPVVLAVRPRPQVGGRGAKALLAEAVRMEADVICDGHDLLRVELCWQPPGAGSAAFCTLLSPVGNDTYATSISMDELGRHHFEVRAAVDAFASFRAPPESPTRRAVGGARGHRP
jgi:starch synthase (maltosyl-transferring)